MKKNILKINTDLCNNNNFKNQQNFRTSYNDSYSNFNNNYNIYNYNNNNFNSTFDNYSNQKKNYPNQKEIFGVVHKEPLKSNYKYNYKNSSQFIIS